MKWIKIILITLLALVLLFFAFVCWLLSDEVKLASNYYKIEILEEDIVDYQVFLNPSGKFQILDSIDESIRKQIAEYMKKRNLKLSPGIQEFNRVSGTFWSLISEDFKFEKINKSKSP